MCYLPGNNQCGVVKFLIYVFFGYGRVGYYFGQVRAERFYNGKYDFTCRRLYGVAFYEVEKSVRI